MFRDFPVRAAHYDRKDDAFVVTCSETFPRGGSHDAQLLLDARGHLVGIDFGGEGMNRLVVMLGPHERVARTEDVRVSIEGGGGTIRVQGSAAKLVAPGANPYVF